MARQTKEHRTTQRLERSIEMKIWTISKLVGLVALLALASLLGTGVLTTPHGVSIAETAPTGASPPVLVSVPDPFAPHDCGLVASRAFRPQNSPTNPIVAVNPVDPDNIVVVYQVDGFITNLARVSKDGGVSWKTVFIPGLTPCTGGTHQFANDPSLTFSADGSVLYLASNMVPVYVPLIGGTTNVLVNRSTDGGETWSQPSQVTPNDGLMGHWAFITPDAFLPSTAYINFVRHHQAHEIPSTLYFRRTDDGGETWSPPTVVYAAPIAGLVPMPAKTWRTAEGTLVSLFERQIGCVYQDPPDVDAEVVDPVVTPAVQNCLDPAQVEDNVVYAAVSNDGGQTWDEPVRVARRTAGPGTGPNGPVCHIGTIVTSAAAADGTVFAVISTSHRGEEPGFGQKVSLDVYRSQDGKAWSQVSSLAGSRMGLPTIAVAPDGTVGMTYYQLREKFCGDSVGAPSLTDVWFAGSSDMGQTWTTEKLAGPFDAATSCYLVGTPAELCSIGDYGDLQPAGPRSFAAVYEVTTPVNPCGACNGGISDIFFSAITNPAPDLQVTDITPSKTHSLREGDKITLTTTVSNLGDADAAASTTDFVLDGSIALGTAATGPIPAGGSATVSVGWDTAGVKGEHTIFVTTDSEQAVAESNEVNNTSNLTVTIQGNRVMNSSFERPNEEGSSPEGWTPSDAGSAGTASWSASGTVSLSGDGGSAALGGSASWTSDAIAVNAGETLTLGVSVNPGGVSSPPTAGLTYLNEVGEVIGTAILITAPLNSQAFTTLGAGAVVPVGVVKVRVVLGGFSPLDMSTAGTVTFNEVRLFGD